MKSIQQLLAVGALFAAGFPQSNAFRTTLDFMSHGGALSAAGESMSGATSDATLGKMISDMVTDNGPSIHDVTEVALNRMDVRDAVRRVDGKLPGDVASLVRLSSSSHGKSRGFREASIQKARHILNTMIEEAWADLDTILIACKEFYLRNRKTYAQVIRDLNRLGSQMSDADGRRIKASEGIAKEVRTKAELDRTLQEQTKSYMTDRRDEEQDLIVKRGDEAVFAFILSLVRCADTAATGTAATLAQQSSNNNVSFKICNVGGNAELSFDDPKLQAKVEKDMTPSARRVYHSILARMAAQDSFLQVGEKTNQAPGNASSSTATITFQTIAEPVIDQATPSVQWKKCADGTPNCGLLHDLMAMQWGKFKDLVDELEKQMEEKEDEWERLKSDLNAQIEASNVAKGEHMESLAEAISNLNQDSSERQEKDEERRDLARVFDKKMKECHDKASEILFTNICAVRKVRNAVLRHSSTSPLSAVSDCAVSEWKPGQCSMECDDSCNGGTGANADPYQCGGWQILKRTITVSANSFGFKCPALAASKKCNQIKCPVDCVMSDWSTWSTCTKECGGGVKTKTRSILDVPKNGGTECGTPSEEEPCKTGSCDRDCTLVPWSDWSPCSMACSGGLATRTRKVLVPIRGEGKCPTETSNRRFTDKQCNTHDCIGDEICIATQDLIMMIDGSGSLKTEGFATLRTFAANLTDRYFPEYYGEAQVRLGVVLFGNGRLENDGSISRALQIQALTADMADTKTKLRAMTWQRGFTNMAQGFAAADKMLTEQGRKDAQSTVMVLWDGKLNFEFQTAEQAKALHEKNVQVFMAPVTETSGEELDFMKIKLASQPWETNFLRIPGMDALGQNEELFAGQIVAKFCSDSISPSLEMAKDVANAYMLIHERGFPSNSCGRWYWIGRVAGKDECAEAARGKGQMAFSYGKGRYASNNCYSEAIDVTNQKWAGWLANKTGPACPNGRWITNPYYDVYAMNPSNGR